jgi:DNA-binding MarR family transcriptional regulator
MRLEEKISTSGYTSLYQQTFLNLLFTTNALHASLAADLRQYDLTTQQYNILRILRGQNSQPVTIKLIRSRMLDRMSDTSRIIKNLTLKGFVERKVDSSDRRNAHIFITQRGLNFLEELDYIDDLVKTRMNNLSDAEILQLNQLLDKLRG